MLAFGPRKSPAMVIAITATAAGHNFYAVLVLTTRKAVHELALRTSNIPGSVCGSKDALVA
jgi:hypothetical protein